MTNTTVTSKSVRLPSNRREAALWLFLAGGLLALMGLLTALTIYSYPRAPGITVGKLSDFPTGAEPKLVTANGMRFVVVNLNGELIVYDAHDTHTFHCIIKWIPSEHHFEDPCSGSRFAINGTFISGPAPRDLDRYATTIDAGGNINVLLWKVYLGKPVH